MSSISSGYLLSKTMKDPHRSPQINELEGAKPGVYWANLTYFDGIFSVCMAGIDHYTPLSRDPQLSQWVGGGTGQEVKGEHYHGEWGRVTGGRCL